MARWKNFSISKKLYVVVGTMAVLILLELIVLRFAMSNLSAVRAFVHGEGNWSKAHKDAIYHLQRFELTKNDKDFARFHDSFSIPDGDHAARLQLESGMPDMQKVREGFIQGGVHPDDVEPMVNLLSRFSSISYIAEAIQAWRRGDELLVDLRNTGDRYRELVLAGKPVDDVVEKISEINQELTAVERRFSDVLGEGSRWLERLVFAGLFCLVLTVECFGLTLTILTTRRLSRELSELNIAAARIGQGDFGLKLAVHSEDELGRLTRSVNEMSSLLEKSYSELEQKVADRTRELETAVQMREEFLSIASHELKTPIQSLMLQLQIMERSMHQTQSSDPQKFQDQFRKSVALAKRIAVLQNSLMDLTEIRLQKFAIKKSSTDVGVLIAEVCENLEPEAALRGARLVTKVDGDVTAEVDPTRVSQVITNLIGNAIKYGGGRPVEISGSSDQESVYVYVKDYGPGIPEELHLKILERYERVNTDQSIAGLGLGLYVSKQILDAHGGELSLVSRPGEGATFKLRLPKRELT